MDTIDNKYKRWHDRLIAKRRATPATGHVEAHHILPRSLGGNDNPDNMVDLTPREHVAVHCMLTRFTIGIARQKMASAVCFMLNRKSKKTLRIRLWREYDKAKRERSCMMSEIMTRRWADPEARRKQSEVGKLRWKCTNRRRNASAAGKRTMSDPAQRRKVSEVHKGRRRPPETGRKISAANIGKKVSSETRAKISAANKLRPPPSIETRRKQSEAVKLALAAPEVRRKLRESRLGKKASPETCAKISAVKKGLKHSAAARAKMSAAAKRRMADPNVRRNLSELNKGKNMSAETRAKISAATKRALADPEIKRKHSEGVRRAQADPEYRRKQSEARKRRLPDSAETRRNKSEAAKRREAAKRHSIYQTLRHFVENGIAPEEIAKNCGPQANRVLISIDGEVAGEDFCHVATKVRANDGRNFNPKHFFSSNDELVRFEGRTYAFSNQWGAANWEKAMLNLCEAFPDQDIVFVPTE